VFMEPSIFPTTSWAEGADLSGLVRRLAGMGVESNPGEDFSGVLMDLLELPYSLSLAEFEEPWSLPVVLCST